MHLQCLPIKKITGARGTLTTLDRTLFILLLLALYGSTPSFVASTMDFLALYGSPCIPPVLCCVFRAIFFFCLVCGSLEKII